MASASGRIMTSARESIKSAIRFESVVTTTLSMSGQRHAASRVHKIRGFPHSGYMFLLSSDFEPALAGITAKVMLMSLFYGGRAVEDFQLH